MGIKQLHHWQSACLDNNAVTYNGENLVYCAPTSGGKTLVTEILMIRRIIESRKKCIFVLPYISIIQEKRKYFENLFKKTDIKVSGHFSGSKNDFDFIENDVIFIIIKSY
jgi:DNA polymerase theta